MTDRAQAFTLEAFVASLLLLGSVLFALQATAVTANSASTASEQAERQLEHSATGVVDAAAENSSLRPTLLYWNHTSESFHDASESYYVAETPPTRFGRLLDRTLSRPDTAVNVNVQYVGPTDDLRTQQLVDQGTPSDQAVSAARTVTLYDDNRLRRADGQRSDQNLSETTGFYAPDVAPESPVYNVVRVEVIVWRV